MSKVMKKRNSKSEADLQAIAKSVYGDDGRLRTIEDAKAVIVSGDLPKPKRYVPPEHSECAGIRPANERYASVVTVTRVNTERELIITRYCTCGFCHPVSDTDSRRPITHKDVQIVSHKSK